MNRKCSFTKIQSVFFIFFSGWLGPLCTVFLFASSFSLATVNSGLQSAKGITSDQIPSVSAKKVSFSKILETLVYPVKIESEVNSIVLSEVDGIVTSVLQIGTSVKINKKIIQIQQTDPIFKYAPFEVLAPVVGVISEVLVSKGSQVVRGQKLATITDPSRLQIFAEIVSSEMKKIKKGQRGQLKLSSDDKELYEVEVVGLSPLVNPSTGTSTAIMKLLSSSPKVSVKGKNKTTAKTKKLEAETDLKNIFPGQLGQVNFIVAERNAFLVSEESVFYRGAQPFIRIISENKVLFREVKLGERDQGLIEITQGLKENELIVERSIGFIPDNSEVRVQ